GTAYIVMAYERGISLGERLRDGATLPEPQLRPLLEPLMSGLETVHKARFLHRDIKPDNIYLRDDGSPVLLDFGSARQAIGARTQAITSIVSPGYSPFEQYGKSAGDQGPWTDIYALGATLYRCVAGKRPPPALDRVGGKAALAPAAELGRKKYESALLRAIDAALAVRAEDRPQSIADLRAIMRGEPRGGPALAETGATLVAGGPPAKEGSPVHTEAGATLVSGGRAADRVRAPAEAAPRPKARAWRDILRNARPVHLAIAGGAMFAALIGMIVLLIVL